jgi:hypothetical protein
MDGGYAIVDSVITIDVGAVVITGTCIRRSGRLPADTSVLAPEIIRALDGQRSLVRRGDRILLQDLAGATQVVLTPKNDAPPRYAPA